MRPTSAFGILGLVISAMPWAIFGAMAWFQPS